MAGTNQETPHVTADRSKMKPGDAHYMAYVGPPGQFDFMGATQFRLLTTLGLRAHHRVLDFGCGSLRAGRLLIPYLDAGNYFGIEPNRWLIEDAIEHEIGHDVLRIKSPRFDHNDEFSADVFATEFDFVVAQSIFSHAHAEAVDRALAGFAATLASGGLIAATFVEGETDHEGTEWVYPGCVRYRPETVMAFAARAGLQAVRLPWYHPRQVWYLFAREAADLPGDTALRHLTGAVLNDPAFADSV